MVLYLDRIVRKCQCGLHAVLCSHIGIFMRRLAAEPRRTAGLLVLYLCPSGTILLIQYSMVWDWLVSRAGPMLFYWTNLLYPFYSLLLFFPFQPVYRLVLLGWVLRTDNRTRNNGAKLVVKHFTTSVAQHFYTIKITTTWNAVTK